MDDHRTDSGDPTKSNNVNTLDYFRSSANREADKEDSMSIRERIYDKLSDVLQVVGVFMIPSN